MKTLIKKREGEMRRTHTKTIGHVIELLREADTKDERIQILKENDSVALQCIFRMQYDPSLVFALPKGKPKYKELDVPDDFGETSLIQQTKSFYLFLEGKHKTLTDVKRKQIFTRLLEALDKREAKVILDVKDKKLSCGVTEQIVREVWPNILPEKAEKPKKAPKKKVAKKKAKAKPVPKTEVNEIEIKE